MSVAHGPGTPSPSSSPACAGARVSGVVTMVTVGLAMSGPRTNSTRASARRAAIGTPASGVVCSWTAAITAAPSAAGTRRVMTSEPSSSAWRQDNERVASWRSASAALMRRWLRTICSTWAAVASRATFSQVVSVAGMAIRVTARTLDQVIAPELSARAMAGRQRRAWATRMCSEAATDPRPQRHDSHWAALTQPSFSQTWRARNSPSRARNRALDAASTAEAPARAVANPSADSSAGSSHASSFSTTPATCTIAASPASVAAPAVDPAHLNSTKGV